MHRTGQSITKVSPGHMPSLSVIGVKFPMSPRLVLVVSKRIYQELSRPRNMLQTRTNPHIAVYELLIAKTVKW